MSHSETLWNLLPLPKGTYRYMMAKAVTGQNYNTYVTSPQVADRLILWANTKHMSLYVQGNPARTKAVLRPKASDVSHLQLICFDLDPLETALPALRKAGSIPEYQKAALALGNTPSLAPFEDNLAILDSGRGYQIWLVLAPTPVVGDLGRRVSWFVHQVAKEFGVQHGCLIDTSCSDLPRLVRMPGSINQKTGRQAEFVAVPKEPVRADFLYDLDLPPESAMPSPQAFGSWQHYLPYLTQKAETFILLGVEEPGRHAACFAAAKSLVEAGCPLPLTREALLVGAASCRPALPGQEIEKILRGAYRVQ